MDWYPRQNHSLREKNHSGVLSGELQGNQSTSALDRLFRLALLTERRWSWVRSISITGNTVCKVSKLTMHFSDTIWELHPPCPNIAFMVLVWSMFFIQKSWWDECTHELYIILFEIKISLVLPDNPISSNIGKPVTTLTTRTFQGCVSINVELRKIKALMLCGIKNLTEAWFLLAVAS